MCPCNQHAADSETGRASWAAKAARCGMILSVTIVTVDVLHAMAMAAMSNHPRGALAYRAGLLGSFRATVVLSWVRSSWFRSAPWWSFSTARNSLTAPRTLETWRTSSRSTDSAGDLRLLELAAITSIGMLVYSSNHRSGCGCAFRA